MSSPKPPACPIGHPISPRQPATHGSLPTRYRDTVGTMIHDIDESLRELVRRDVVNSTNVDVTFDAPTKDWASRRTGPTLNLYLYDIQEDMQRRAVQFEEIRNSKGIITDRRLLPRKFRLSYLVTAWTQRPEDEHRLLGAVLGCFLRSEALPSEVLKGSAAGADEPIRTTIGLPLPKDRQLSDIWSALGGELKPALDLVVTAPFDTRRLMDVGPPVTEQPRIAVGGSDGGFEVAQRKRRGRGGEPPLPRIESIEETVYGGAPEAGEADTREGRSAETSEDASTDAVATGAWRRPGRRIVLRTIPPPDDLGQP